MKLESQLTAAKISNLINCSFHSFHLWLKLFCIQRKSRKNILTWKTLDYKPSKFSIFIRKRTALVEFSTQILSSRVLRLEVEGLNEEMKHVLIGAYNSIIVLKNGIDYSDLIMSFCKMTLMRIIVKSSL